MEPIASHYAIFLHDARLRNSIVDQAERRPVGRVMIQFPGWLPNILHRLANGIDPRAPGCSGAASTGQSLGVNDLLDVARYGWVPFRQ